MTDFQYIIRGEQLETKTGHRLAQAYEQRDRDIEDFLTNVATLLDELSIRVAVLQQEVGSLQEVFTSQWTYRAELGPPPTTGTLRGDAVPATELYIHIEDTDGVNQYPGMNAVRTGDVIWLRSGGADNYSKYQVDFVTPATTGTDYFTFEVTSLAQSGTVNQNALITVTFVISSSGYANYNYGGTDVVNDPGAGNITQVGTGSNPRTFAVSAIDADGLDRNLSRIATGENFTITDDPDVPSVYGFATFVTTSDVTLVDQSAWGFFSAERVVTSGGGGTLPLGTPLRVYF